jgi:MFS family permease
MISRFRKTYTEYPSTFWTLIGATFIDSLGGALLFPFFALYVTRKFGVGMTEVGILFAIYAVSSLVGSVVGGALADRIGRRSIVIFSLVASALSSLLMGLVVDLNVFYGLAVMVGLLASAGGPARQAMVADLVPQEQRTEAYGILRVVANLAVAIGPAIGGILADRSFLLLFIIDAIASIITAVIVYLSIPETKPETKVEKKEEGFLKLLGGYLVIMQDGLFIAFFITYVLMTMVYVQLNSSLSVYLRDVHGVPARGFGYLMSMNAAMVVLFQFAIARRLRGRPPFLVMAIGTVLYGVGFLMYGLVGVYPMFMVAMVIITIGEMVIMPVAQALVARLAPEDMRGRYMAFFSFAWAIPFAVGPLAAGQIMDNYDPVWVWYASGIIAAIAVLGYLWLHVSVGAKVIEGEVATAAETA